MCEERLRIGPGLPLARALNRPFVPFMVDAILLARKLRRDLREAGLEPPEDDWPTRPSG